MMPRKLYVRKQPQAAVRERQLFAELTELLGLRELTEIASYRRYLVFDTLTEEAWKRLCQGLFIEAPVDWTSEDESFLDAFDHVFAIAPLPAQFDATKNAGEEAASLILNAPLEHLFTAEVIGIKGELDAAELQKIKNYLINPIENMEVATRPPFDMPEMAETKQHLREFPELLKLADDKLAGFLEEVGLGLSVEDLRMVRDYFKELDRAPNELELRVLDTYWSDHCRHTSFNTGLLFDEAFGGPLKDKLRETYADFKKVRAELGRTKPVSLMEIATLPPRYQRKMGEIDDVEFSAEINAATLERKVTVDGQEEDYLLLFKNETHNHPTEIEPEGGAATCLGGAIRDPLSGRAYVYQAMRVTGAADPNTPLEDTLEGKLPQRTICRGAAEGYSSYGNRMGLPGTHIREYYHPNFVAKRFECGAVLGAVPAAQVQKTEPSPGDIVFLIGGDTGRDGIGGATGSSKEQDHETLKTAASEVQKGNPTEERKLQRLFMRPEFTRLIKRCNDFGAGGVSVAVGELCRGLTIDLDKVPLKYQGLNPLEIALSESQERMAIVVKAADADKVRDLAAAENLKASLIARVTEEPVLAMNYHGETVLRLDRSFLDTEGASREAEMVIPDTAEPLSGIQNAPESFGETLKNRARDWRYPSLVGLQELFDASIGQTTLAHPYGGLKQKSPEMGIAARIPARGASTTMSLMTQSYDPDVAQNSPWHGALYAITGSLLKILALGGNPLRARLSLQEYFERLDNPESWGKAFLAVLSAYRAQRAFKVPAIGGKDSVSGSFGKINVPPTLVSFAVDSQDEANYRPAVLPAGKGVKLFAWDLMTPDYDIDFDKYHAEVERIMTLLRQEQTVAAFVPDAAGLAFAVARAGFGNGHGIDFTEELSVAELFAPRMATLVIATTADAPRDLLTFIGQTNGEDVLRFKGETVKLTELAELNEATLATIYPHYGEQGSLRPAACEADLSELLEEKVAAQPAFEVKTFNLGGKKPKVLIPTFPGTNCELDTARAFELAGAEPEIFLFRNLDQDVLNASLNELAAKLDAAQILAIPGGFSAADEPDGSAKFIRATFLNDALRTAFDKHVADENLVLGICNGFQALIKLGVFKNNVIEPLAADDLTLSFNQGGRHLARIVDTKARFTGSPWLRNVTPGETFRIPISHGEGRIVGSERALREVIERGQVAFTYDKANPNGSALSIEGLISPNGLILGKMGHSERALDGLFANVPGMKTEGIFAAGVAYFQ